MTGAVYESKGIRAIMGEALRPGGFILTERAIDYCQLDKGMRVLDIGCGMGATVNYLREELGLEAYGIEPSEKLIQLGKQKYNLSLERGRGESLPYGEEIFHAVFAECTLSLMDDYKKGLSQVYRVLKEGGYFIVSDMFANKVDHIPALKRTGVKSCLGNLFDLNSLKKDMKDHAFKILVLEDQSFLLKQLMVEIIFKYGSMTEFWNVATCGKGHEFKEKLAHCKPGYFFMIGKKEG